MAALEWRDADRDAAVVYIRRVVASGRVKEPKTERSRRRVPLTSRAVRVLEMHYAHLVRDAEETARAKLDAHAAASV